MRVLQLAPLYQPIRGDMEYGSVERLVLLLDQGISAAGHRVVTIAREGSQLDGEMVPVARASGYEEQARLALEIVTGSAFDVIQVHRREFFEQGAASMLRRDRPEVKVVATLRGTPGKIRRYYTGYGPLASFVFVSRAQAAGTPGFPGTVIHNAVDVASVPFRPGPAQPSYLSFLGHVSAEKGVAEAITLARWARFPLKIGGIVQERDRQFRVCRGAATAGGPR
jgi:hypothetical protein